MCIRAISIVNIHADRVQLLQTSQRIEKHDDNATSLNSFHGTAKHIRRKTLEVLQHTHAKRLTEDLVRVFVETEANILRAHELLN